jgi:hypothetical protein
MAKRKAVEELQQSKKQKPNIDQKQWVSGYAIRNYLLHDPLLDWLDMYYDKTTIGLPNAPNKEIDEFLKFLFASGLKFEKEIAEEIKKKVGAKNFVTIVTDMKDKDKYDDTLAEMLKGTPVIYQGTVKDFDKYINGTADLIVRSDWVNKLVKKCVLSSKEEKIKAPKLNGNYHYVIIDIKWCTLDLCADGRHLLNSNRVPAYKGQVFIYSEALGYMQGYVPRNAYLLGKRNKYTSKGYKYSSDSWDDRLGVVDFDGFDEPYKTSSYIGIGWIRDLRQNGATWNVCPPSRPELYPNMSNYNDAPWHAVKSIIADEIKEITMLWNCGYKNRCIGNSNKIYRWDDPRCSSENLGVNGAIVGSTLQKIIDINRPECTSLVVPKRIKNNDYDWKNKKKLELFVDFEYIPEILTESINYIFIFGLGWVYNDEWHYETFVPKNISNEEEQKTMDQFVNRIDELRKIYKAENNYVYCYGHAEDYIFNYINSVYSHIWSGHNIIFSDMLRVFRGEPVVFKNCLKFGLKDIGKALYKNNLIPDTWEEGMNGQQAMIDGFKCYENYDPVNCDMMKKLVSYNEMDCKILWEIIKYLRENNC